MTPWIIKESGLALTLGVRAITLYPLIFCAEEAPSALLLAHESIHVDQIRRDGWFRFYWRYWKDYLDARILGMSHRGAYLTIPYEADAYSNQGMRLKNLPDWATVRKSRTVQ